MRRLGIGLGFLALLLVGVGAGGAAQAQPDSVRTALLKAEGYSPDHSPRNALWRAVAVPGWGQFYNRQYYKMPFVYAGLAGAGFAIYEMNRRYRLFRHANLYKIGESEAGEGEENQYQHFEDEYNQAVERLGGEGQVGEVGGRQLRSLRDKHRRWRDLSIVGTGLFYALTVLDAYISAHLLTFNVGEDLALNVRPTGGEHMLTRLGGAGARSPLPRSEGVGLRVRVRF